MYRWDEERVPLPGRGGEADEYHHLLMALVDPRDDTVQAVRVAGRAVGAKGVAA